MKGAEESDEEEKNAKKHKCKEKEKNAISFMDTAFNWNEEFPVVESLKNEIVTLIDKDIIPKSFISKIMAHAANAKIENHTIKQIKTFWILTYDLNRMKDRIKGENARKVIENCIIEVCGKKEVLNGKPIRTDYHPLELWAFASRWAELELRTNK